MKRNTFRILFIVSTGIVFLIPIMTNILALKVWIFDVAQDNIWIDFWGSYSSGIIGGILGGLFTYFGVKMTLDKQINDQNTLKRRHQIMLYNQLKFTYEMFEGLERHSALYPINVVIFDKDWFQHLTYVDNLNEVEFQVVLKWFYNMEQIEFNARSRNNSVELTYVKSLIGSQIVTIGEIINKFNKSLQLNV